MDIYSSISNLLIYLSNTQEFKNLKKSKQEIAKNPSLNALITQFQKKQEALYSQKLSQMQIEQLMNELNNEYEKLLRIPEIGRYFNAVDSFNEQLNNVMKEVNASLEKQL